MAKKNIILSIIISNFNTKKKITDTILLLYKNITDIPFEIIVVDDASTDGSAFQIRKKFPDINLIINKKNAGYSKSYNIGTRKAKGEYILHLNSDILLINKNSISRIIHTMEKDKSIGITGCKILKMDNSLDLPCRRSFPTLRNVFFQSVGLSRLFPKNRLFGQYYLTYTDEDKIQEIDCLMGAFMLIRKEVFSKIGLLDERFFIYGEDIDFCFRAKQAGWKILYYPKVIVKHYHGGTTSSSRYKFTWLFHYAMFQFYKKHYLNKYPQLVNGLVYTAVFLRYLLYLTIDFGSTLRLNKVWNRRKASL